MRLSMVLWAILQLARASPSFLVDPSCPDYDLSLVCTDKCDNDYLECITSCGSSDCFMECSREIVTCSDSCPCHTDCIDGCDGCDNPICFICNDNQNEDNLEACITKNSRTLGECILDCKDDTSCEATCVSSFKNDHSECPCQKKCPLGCPCDNYDCNLPDKKAILVLYSGSSSKPSVLIQPNGGITDNFEFKMDDDTEVYFSCSATLNGKLFVFGGHTQKKQVSKVIDCGLKRIGDLSYDFVYGTCATYNFTSERILLCFSASTYEYLKKCESYDGFAFHNHQDSKFTHKYITLANTNGSPLAVGGTDYARFHKKCETYNFSANTWNEVADYPYQNSFATVTTSEGAIIIGSGTYVALYSSSGWSRLDNLHTPRSYHRAIVNGDKVYIIGGYGSQYTEIWSIDGESKYIQLAEPQLENYAFYPELMLVDTKYCVKP